MKLSANVQREHSVLISSIFRNAFGQCKLCQHYTTTKAILQIECTEPFSGVHKEAIQYVAVSGSLLGFSLEQIQVMLICHSEQSHPSLSLTYES
jgi:hypothetical protein